MASWPIRNTLTEIASMSCKLGPARMEYRKLTKQHEAQ